MRAPAAPATGPHPGREVGGDRVAGAGAEDGTLQQRVRGEPVRTVHAGAGDLADRVEAGDRRAALDVGDDPAHQVVRGRSHRDRVARPVEAAIAHGAVDRGEAAREERGALLVRRPKAGRVEAHRASVLQLHLPRDRAGDDVARGELAVRVGVEGETAPVARR